MSTPQTLDDFIAALGEQIAAQVTAVVVIVTAPWLKKPVAIGESAPWVWHHVTRCRLSVQFVLYAGDDRNIAWRLAQDYNKQVWDQGQG